MGLYDYIGSGDFVLDMTDGQMDRLMRDVIDPFNRAASPEPLSRGEAYDVLRGLGFNPDPDSTEALSMDGPMPDTATVEPDHLLRLWAQIDRCAQIAAEALAADLMQQDGTVVDIPAVQSTISTELWASAQDIIGFCRLGVFEEWSE